MSILEGTKCNIKKGDYDNWIAVDEYKGVFSIASITETQDGKTYPRWVYPQVKKDTPGTKAFPLAVRLGDKDTAVRVLRGMADAIEKNQQPASYENKPEPESVLPFGDDGIPF